MEENVRIVKLMLFLTSEEKTRYEFVEFDIVGTTDKFIKIVSVDDPDENPIRKEKTKFRDIHKFIGNNHYFRSYSIFCEPHHIEENKKKLHDSMLSDLLKDQEKLESSIEKLKQSIEK